MAKKKQPFPEVGDAFAVPLLDGRFTVCRVFKIDPKTEQHVVVASSWYGDAVPKVDDPALRPILKLTHHAWNSQLCCTNVFGRLPADFVPIGKIPPLATEKVKKGAGLGAWEFFQIQPWSQWLWDHPEDTPPEPKPTGKFILHRFNGDEVFSLEKAVMWAYESHEGGFTLWFEVEADPKAITRCDDTKKYAHWPTAEVGVVLLKLDADQLVGKTFSMPGTKTDTEDSCMSLLCYYEHEPLRKNKIKIVSQKKDRFQIRWTAVTKDVVYGDGSKPVTKVEIEGEFVFKDMKKWQKPKKK